MEEFLYLNLQQLFLTSARLNYKLDIVVSFVEHLDTSIKSLIANTSGSVKELIESLNSISKEIANFRGHALMIKRR